MRISDWSSDVCSSDLDGDGDTAAATLTITINGADDGVTSEGLDAQGAELSIDEDDLPARAGEAPGSDTTPDGVTDGDRTEERRVGKAEDSPCSSRWSTCP